MSGLALRNLILIGKQFSLFMGVGDIRTVALCLLFVGLMWLLHEAMHLHYFMNQVGTTRVVLIWNFLENRFWTFGR